MTTARSWSRRERAIVALWATAAAALVFDVAAPFGDSVRHLDDVTYLKTGEASTALHHTHGIVGHSRYLEDGSTSQFNLAAITAGLDPSYLRTGAPPPGARAEIVREGVDLAVDVGSTIAPVLRPHFLKW